jgi:hypothetical protein
MKRIVGACLSQFHGDEDNFELLMSDSTGREWGHVLSKQTVLAIAQEFYLQTGHQQNDAIILESLKETKEEIREALPHMSDEEFDLRFGRIDAAISVIEGKP